MTSYPTGSINVKESLYRIPHCMGGWVVTLFISLWQGWTSQRLLHCQPVYECSTTSPHGYCSLCQSLTFWVFRFRVTLSHWMLRYPRSTFEWCLFPVIFWFLGNAKSKIVFPNPLWKRTIVPCLALAFWSFGDVDFDSFFNKLLFMLTIGVLRLQPYVPWVH